MYHKGDFSTFLLLELTKTFSTSKKIVVMTKGSNCKSQTFLKNSTVFSSEIIDAKQKVLLRIFSNNRLCEESNAYNLNHLFFSYCEEVFEVNEKRDKFKSKVLLKIYIQVKIKYKTEISQFTIGNITEIFRSLSIEPSMWVDFF